MGRRATDVLAIAALLTAAAAAAQPAGTPFGTARTGRAAGYGLAATIPSGSAPRAAAPRGRVPLPLARDRMTVPFNATIRTPGSEATPNRNPARFGEPGTSLADKSDRRLGRRVGQSFGQRLGGNANGPLISNAGDLRDPRDLLESRRVDLGRTQ